ncbi:hypothetical protein PGB90_005448 [Kerria lacca]
MAAKEATCVTPIPQEPIPAQDLIHLLRLGITSSWNTQWSNLPQIHGLRAIQPIPRKWTSSPPLKRKEEISLRLLRIGHISLTHTHLLRGDLLPTCISCNVPLSIHHLLLHCLTLTAARRRTKLPTSLQDILSSTPEAISSLLNFLTAAKITP